MADSYIYLNGAKVATTTVKTSDGGTVNVLKLTASEGEQIAAGDRDTDGNPVPTHKGHAYTYDTSGNLETDTVADAGNTWVRTYDWDNGVQLADSGWVKQ